MKLLTNGGIFNPGDFKPQVHVWLPAKGPKQSRASSTIGLWPASTKYLAQERPHDDRLHLYIQNILAFLPSWAPTEKTITTNIAHLFPSFYDASVNMISSFFQVVQSLRSTDLCKLPPHHAHHGHCLTGRRQWWPPAKPGLFPARNLWIC